MARIETDPNYSNPTFSRATAPTDLFKATDVQNLAAAMSTHTHNTAGGKGAPLETSSVHGGVLQDRTLAGTKLQVGTIGTTEIADGGILAGDIANGVLTSTQLAGGAATSIIGIYQSIPSFSSSSTGTWIATPVAVTGTFSSVSGAITLIWATAVVSGSVQGGYARLGILKDGGPISGAHGLLMLPTAGYALTISLHAYDQPTQGNHTWAFGVINNTAGTIGLDGATVASLIVLELRR
jgi:hypothetical protein